MKLTVAVLVSIFTLTYMMPWAIAWYRGKKNVVPIFLVNAFLGWLLIPWFVAIVWAFMQED